MKGNIETKTKQNKTKQNTPKTNQRQKAGKVYVYMYVCMKLWL